MALAVARVFEGGDVGVEQLARGEAIEEGPELPVGVRLGGGALEERIERVERDMRALDQETRARDALLEIAIRDLKVDIRDVAGKVEPLVRIEERVAAIERRLT